MKNLKLQKKVFSIVGKGCILTGFGFVGAAVDLEFNWLSNVNEVLIGFASLTTGVRFMSNIPKNEMENDISILSKRKY